MTKIYCVVEDCYNWIDNNNYPSHCRLESVRIDVKEPSEFEGEDKAECTSFNVLKIKRSKI